MDRVKIAELIAEEWNARGIKYAVAHGVENYPSSLGRDLDVLINKEDVEEALKIVVEICKNHQWIYVKPPDLWGKRLVLFGRDLWKDSLEIHTLTKLSWRGVTLASEPQPTTYIGPFKIDPWVSFLKGFLMILLAGQVERLSPDEIKKQWASVSNDNVLQFNLKHLFGEKLYHKILQEMSEGEVGSLKNLLPEMRRTLVVRFIKRRPLEFVQGFTVAFWRKLVQVFYPCGPVICIVGESSVKSAVLERMKEEDASVFTGISIRSSLNGPISYCAAFLRDRIESARQRVVIYDLERAGNKGLPFNPDLIVVLGSHDEYSGPERDVKEVYIDTASYEKALTYLRSLIVQAFIKKNGGNYVSQKE